MSENQWLIVNGYDSRNSENRYFQSKNKELKFTGKVPADYNTPQKLDQKIVVNKIE